MEQISLSAYCKINLTLAITGRRKDGYHTLESVMQAISLADTVTMQKIPCGILFACSDNHLPQDESNLAFRAAKLYLEEGNIDGGVKIDLIKRIPHGAGLGGGSSDAAAVLSGMKALFPSSLSLPDLALKLGADVPFFLEGKTAFCEGIGEKLTPISFPNKQNLSCVVAKNCPGVSTPEVYRLYDKTMGETFSRSDKKAILSALETGNLSAFVSRMKNDLELAAISLRPDIAALKQRLLESGADAAMMTGSGSAVFGLFSSEKTAKAALRELKENGVEAYFSVLL